MFRFEHTDFLWALTADTSINCNFYLDGDLEEEGIAAIW